MYIHIYVLGKSGLKVGRDLFQMFVFMCDFLLPEKFIQEKRSFSVLKINFKGVTFFNFLMELW